jgi:hypothetical protein
MYYQASIHPTTLTKQAILAETIKLLQCGTFQNLRDRGRKFLESDKTKRRYLQAL